MLKLLWFDILLYEMIEAKYKLITRAEDLRAACEELSRHQLAGLDTETTDLDPYRGQLRLVQLSTPDDVFIFDIFAFNNPKKNDELKPLREIISAARPVKIAHNAKFDAKWIRLHLGVDIGGLFDTLLSSQIISAGDTEERHNLAAAVSRYLNETLDKSEQLSNWSGELSESQLRYATLDAAVMIPLREKMVERLKKDSLVKCAQLEFECVMPMAHLELAGIFLDAVRWREQLEIVKKKREQFADELQEMLAEGALQGSLFGRAEINLDSHVKVNDALKRLGVPMPENTRGWQLQPLAEQYPAVKKLLEYRGVQKALTSYGENILSEINPVTNRIHADFYQIGAPTGRMACNRPNIQQVPHGEEYRRCFRAPEKRKFVIADYCVTKGTRIATRRGLIPIEQIKLSDHVCLEDNKTASVSAIIKRGKLSVVKLTLRNGYSITATELHRIRVIDSSGNYVWRRIGEIKKRDFVVVQPGRGISQRKDYEMLPNIELNHHNNTAFSTPKFADEHFALFFGYICGDGSLSKRSIKWVVNQQDSDVAYRLDELASNLFGLSVHKRPPYRGVFESMINSTPLVSWCEKIGIGKDHVPEFLWQSKRSVVTTFLRGLFEADGSVTNSVTGKASFASSRSRLAFEVHQLLLALGVPSTLREQNATGPGKKFKCWSVSIVANGLQKFADEIGFLSNRKRQKLNALLTRWTGKTVVGNMPNLNEKIRSLHLSGEVRRLLNNASSMGRPISSALALTIEENYPNVAQSLELKHLNQYKQLFLAPVSIEHIGEEDVYDLSVPGPMTYISDGIVSHNSQIELRILADFSKDEGFMEAFKSGADLHKTTAAQVFNVAPEDVTSEQRSFSKRLNFGVVYGIGAPRFAMLTGVSTEEAEGMMRRYFQTYKGLDKWLRDAGNRAVREKQARTASGRLIKFRFDENDNRQIGGTKRNGMNSPIQGSSADILKRALKLLYDELKETNACIVNVVHDEIVVECDEQEATEIAKKVEDSMCAAGEEFVKRVPVKVDAEIKEEWVK